MAKVVEYSERVNRPEACFPSPANCPGEGGAARPRAGGPHAGGRRPRRRHEARVVARAQSRREDQRADSILQF